MKFTKEQLNLENGLTKEWLITNGIGGYASSSIIGANTRKYHGLLIAPLTPPARRFLMLSKVDESITIDDNNFDLYTNVCEEYISQGYKNQVGFEKNFVPVFKYEIENVKITKIICMEYGKNTVGIYYKIENNEDKQIKLKLAPVINFRDFHCINKNESFLLRQNVKDTKVKIVLNEHAETPMYMHLSKGRYIEHHNDVFKNMFYPEEQKRGFDPKENHAVPGVYEVDINANKTQEISFVFSLEENIEKINVKKLIDKEIIRLNMIFNDSLLIDNRKQKKTKKEKELDEEIKTYLVAADNFIVYRPTFRLHTVIAGYPWFLDWGRDSLIAFEGLLLIPKRFEEAKQVLQTMVRDIKMGLVPNGYSGFDNRPLYNSVDASLLLFEQIHKYVKYTGDNEFVKKVLYKKMKEIIKNYIKGIDIDNNNIYLDSDGLIVSGRPDTQNTWMDVKCGDYAVTPRNGKAVEINALWYNALKIIEGYAKKYGEQKEEKEYRKLARECKKSFNEKFYIKRKKSLYDVLGDDKIRPNQLFALSLTYPIIDPKSEEATNIIKTVERHLLNDYGLKTLSSKDEGYVEVYEGNEYQRDTSYHQGITWPWLLGLYYDSLKNIRDSLKAKTKKEELQDKIDKFRKKTSKVFKKELEENGCIGSIAEIYDSKKPQLPKGTIAQAWSISEVFRIVLGK